MFSEVSDVERSEWRMTDDDEYTPGQMKVQDPVHARCANSTQGGESMHMAPRDEDQGTRFDQALAAHGLNRSKLAKRAGVSASTCQKWKDSLSRGDITDSMWHSCATALITVGIDPSEVRPGSTVPSKTRGRELVGPIMAIADPNMLRLLLELLTIENPSDREMLAAIVTSKISLL